MAFLQKNMRTINVLTRIGILASLLAMVAALPGASAIPTPAPGVAQAANCPVTPAETQHPKRQFRAAWIATVKNTDWPTQSGQSINTQKQEFITILDKLQHMHMNAVVVQVRPSADAFYPSQYYPWSQYLTGVQGQDPGYNPLAFMLQETHKRNMEFHAWFNPYRVSLQSQLETLTPNNPARLHPNWVISYGGQLYFNPGLPAVREFITQGILEVVKQYDIDAVHFDDYFYPYPSANQSFPDQATYQQYGKGKFASIADWRRDNVNRFIAGLAAAIKRVKGYVGFGISPFGVWRNQSADPSGSATQASATNYDNLYADIRTWIKHNWIDYVVPQIYWNIGFVRAPYEILVPWWSHEVEGSKVHLYIGQAAYKIGTTGAWLDPDQMPKQLAFNLRYPQVQGSIFFSAKELLANPLGFTERLTNDIYRYPALIPIRPGSYERFPRRVDLHAARQTARGVQLVWSTSPDSSAAYYAIYRFKGDIHPHMCDFNDAQYLLGTIRDSGERAGHSTTFIDTTAQPGQTYTYSITSLDRLHYESRPSDGQTITIQ